MPDTSCASFNPNAWFPECLKTFSTQKPEDFIRDRNSFFMREDGMWTINKNHPFWGEYPMAGWAMRAIAEEFLLQIPLVIERNALNDKGGPSFDALKEIRKNIGLRLKEQLEALIYGIDLDVITAISGEKYESASGKDLSLTLIPRPLTENDIESNSTVILSKKMQIKLNFENIHALRKQLNLVKGTSVETCGQCGRSRLPEGFSMAVCFLPDGEDGNGLYMVGLVPRDFQSVYPSIYYTGHMEWMFCMPAAESMHPRKTCRLRYYQGRLFLPMLDTVNERNAVIKAALDGIEDTRWEKILDFLQTCSTNIKKGGVIILADEACIRRECKHLCGLKRGFELKKKINHSGHEQFVEQASSVDGAIFVDTKLNYHAYGVILDGRAKEHGDISRGARYNSTRNYIEILRKKYPNAHVLGMVVSEDGMIDFFPEDR